MMTLTIYARVTVDWNIQGTSTICSLSSLSDCVFVVSLRRYLMIPFKLTLYLHRFNYISNLKNRLKTSNTHNGNSMELTQQPPR